MKSKKKDLNYHVLFFDGHCVLCQSSVKFILKFEKNEKLKFAPLSGKKAELFLKEDRPDSLIYFDGQNSYYQADAIFKVLRHLKIWFYPLYLFLKVCPKGLVDFIYKKIAASRYNLFGRSSTCYFPRDAEKHRFLD